MAFDNLGEFVAMGNHGFYVWSAYGLTFLIMGGLAWHSVQSHRRARLDIAAQRKRSERQDQPDKLEAQL